MQTEIKKLVTARLSKKGLNAAFLTACLSEMLIGWYNDYANECKEIVKKIVINDLAPNANKQVRNILSKKLEKEKAKILKDFQSFENSVIDFLRVLDNVSEANRDTITEIQNKIYEQLKQ